MTNQMYSKDWEALSAYLDNQLGAKKRARLEARLQTEPALREALEDIRQTRAVLRQAPRVRAPRNFTLTPEMAGRRATRWPRLYPAFQLAFAVASILFAFVVVGDLTTTSVPILSNVSYAPMAERAAEAPAEAETFADDAVSESIVVEESAAGETQDEAPYPSSEEAPSVEKAAESEEIAGAAPEDGAAGAPDKVTPPEDYEMMSVTDDGEEPAEAEPAEAPPAEVPPRGDDEQTTPSPNTPGPPPQPAVEESASPGEDLEDAPTQPTQPQDISAEPRADNREFFRAVELILGILVVASGVGTLYLRQKAR